jgi:two-component system LytT family sensor kinase
MPAQLRTGLPRSVGGLGHTRQLRQLDKGICDGGHAWQPRVRHVPSSIDLPTYVIVIAAPIAMVTMTWAFTRTGRRRREFGSPVDRKTYDTLHTASLAAKHLRDGLTAQSAPKAAKHLRAMLGTQAIALCDIDSTLAWDGTGTHHREHVSRHASEVLTSGRTMVLDAKDVACGDPTCPIRTAILAPVICDEHVVAALAAYGPNASAGLVRATEEVAGWVSTQVELAELGRQRSRTMEAELRALRAQISPHFIYNSLAAIASFVRTDPDRARELLLEFADFTRYAFRRGGAFTTLAEELGNIEHYLALEQARFGDRLQISLLVAPEVLSVAVPYLAIQPLVENAVHHGLESKEGVGHVSITASDWGSEAEIVVEDDGIGSDPDVVRAVLAGRSPEDSVGLGNVDARLRQAYGDDHGLVVETAPGAGTKVTFRVPKFAPGIRPSP